MATSSFDQALRDVLAGSHTPVAAARKVYSELTQDEKLFLLDGDLRPLDVVKQFMRAPYNSVPYHAGTIDRVGIPGIRFSDGPRGSSLGNSTAFPTPSTRAASWDPALEEEVGKAIGAEIRAQGGNLFGGVCVNLAPHPAWGRSQESYGEDPLLIGTMGAALSRGASTHTMPCVKHFALNSMEDMRFTVDVHVDEEVLHEVYLPHFKQVLNEGKAECVMSCYNTINGVQGGQNAQMLNGIIRERWKRDDVFVMSDFIWGLRDAAESVKAGLDIEMMFRNMRAAQLPKAIKDGRITEEDIERLGVRLIAAQLRYHSRMNEEPQPQIDVVGCAEHVAIARRSAASGMVLLKNGRDGPPILPLRKDRIKRLAIIGELATSKQTGDGGSSAVHTPNLISPLEGITAGVPHEVQVVYHNGKNVSSAIRLAQTCDAVFVLVGLTGKEEGESFACTDLEVNAVCNPSWSGSWLATRAFRLAGWLVSSGGDRDDLQLRPADRKLVQELASTIGERIILGVEAGSTICLPSEVVKAVGAILYTGYGGCQFGNALSDVFWGTAEPSGRLPYVIPNDEIADLPTWNRWAKQVTYDRWWGYRMINRDERTPSFPFGFGLGYGRFEFVQGSFSTPARFTDRLFTVDVEVLNSGRVGSSVVVQVYGGKSRPSLRAADYKNVLLGFSKVRIAPNKNATRIRIACRLDPLARYQVKDESWRVSAAEYQLRVGQYEGDPNSLLDVVELERDLRWRS